jgi:hypothetical protein
MLNFARRPTSPMPADELEVPQYSSGHVLALEEVEGMPLRRIAEHWYSLRGVRKFPARADFAPKNLGSLLRHVTLLRVTDGGGDYEFRVLGDVQVQAYGENFRGMKLSEVGERHPRFAEALKLVYDGVRMGGTAFGYRGWIGRDMPDTKYSYHELALFPFGPTDDKVDHILVAGVYVMRGTKTAQ